jgi:hypothetical protein
VFGYATILDVEDSVEGMDKVRPLFFLLLVRGTYWMLSDSGENVKSWIESVFGLGSEQNEESCYLGDPVLMFMHSLYILFPPTLNTVRRNPWELVQTCTYCNPYLVLEHCAIFR